MYIYICTHTSELCSDTWSSPLFAERDAESLEGTPTWMAGQLGDGSSKGGDKT